MHTPERLFAGRDAVTRRHAAAALVSLALPGAQRAAAQPLKRVFRLGILAMGEPVAPNTSNPFTDALAQAGFREGQSLVIDVRSAHSDASRLDALAADLVASQPDAILSASGTRGAMALKRHTATIPIVFGAAGDPVARGLVESLARPGGNLTGNAILSGPLNLKRLQILVEVVGPAASVAVIDNPLPAGSRERYLARLANVAGGKAGRVRLLEAADVKDLEPTFDTIVRERIDAVAVNQSPLASVNQELIADLIARNRLPAIADGRQFSERGVLLTYSTDFKELDRRAGLAIAKIFNGARPADLPVEVAARFELIVNLKTARRLRLKMPASVLARADEVIE